MEKNCCAVITCGLGEVEMEKLVVGSVLQLHNLTAGKPVQIRVDGSRVVAAGETVALDGLPGVRVTSVPPRRNRKVAFV